MPNELRPLSLAQPSRTGTLPIMTTRKSSHGFASMDVTKRCEIASLGGKAAHAQGTGHEFTSEEGKIAGRKGGKIVSRDREHMAMIGRLGGKARKRQTGEKARNSE